MGKMTDCELCPKIPWGCKNPIFDLVCKCGKDFGFGHASGHPHRGFNSSCRGFDLAPKYGEEEISHAVNWLQKASIGSDIEPTEAPAITSPYRIRVIAGKLLDGTANKGDLSEAVVLLFKYADEKEELNEN